jgi:hypothetical protein
MPIIDSGNTEFFATQLTTRRMLCLEKTAPWASPFSVVHCHLPEKITFRCHSLFPAQFHFKKRHRL